MAPADSTEIGAITQNTYQSATGYPCSVPGAVPRGGGGRRSCSFSKMAS